MAGRETQLFLKFSSCVIRTKQFSVLGVYLHVSYGAFQGSTILHAMHEGSLVKLVLEKDNRVWNRNRIMSCLPPSQVFYRGYFKQVISYF